MYKVILITGGSSGIGKAIGEYLNDKGYIVYGTSRNTSKYPESKFKLLTLDVTNNDQIRSCVAHVVKEQGRIDVLINNAGIKKDDLLIRMKDQDWLEVLNINLNSVYKLTKNVTKQMFKQRSGKIVSISSVVGFTGNPGQTNYVSTKSALVGFTKSLAIEVATRGINVNCVAPGMIDSDMIDSLSDKQREGILSRIPMAKLGSPDDVADSCLFLSSDMSNYITGQTLHVNGGMALY